MGVYQMVRSTEASISLVSAVAATVAIAFCFGVAIRRLYLHPLSKIPGPRLWIITRLPYAFTLRRGRLAARLQQLHAQYGPVVRIAADEVSFISEEAWSSFYSFHQCLPKSPLWHRPRVFNGETGIMSSSEASHGRFRRTMNPAFTDKAIKERGDLFQRHSDALISQLRVEAGRDGPVNLQDYFDYLAFDNVSEFSLSSSFQSISKPENRYLVHTLRNFLVMHTLMVVPLSLGLQSIWTSIVPRFARKGYMSTSKSLSDWTRERYDQEEVQDRPDLMTYITARKAKGLSYVEMENAIADVFIAGSETVSTTLLSMCYHLLRRPETLDALTQEVRSSFSSQEDITSDSVQKLPLIEAVRKESMRLCPSLPIVLPRITTEPGMTVNGYWLPPGTMVSFCQFAAYHSPTYFATPDEFRPERWLPDADIKPHYEDIFKPFGAGGRACIGKAMGLAEVRLAMAKLLWNFDLQRGEEDWDWYSQNAFFAWQKRPLYVRLIPRQAS